LAAEVRLNGLLRGTPLPAEPSIRALALAPDRYVGKGVTVTGRFRGANLFARPFDPARLMSTGSERLLTADVV